MEIKLADLPEITKSRLLTAIKAPPPNTFVIDDSKIAISAVGGALALLSIFIVVVQADGYTWEPAEQIFYLALFIASFGVFWTSLVRVFHWFRGEFKADVLINPLYFIRFQHDRIVAFPFTSAEDWDAKRWRGARDSFLGTKFYFRFESGRHTVRVKSSSVAVALFLSLQEFPRYVTDLVNRSDYEALYYLDLLFEWRKREADFPRTRPTDRTAFMRAWMQIWPAMLSGSLGVIVFFLIIVPYNNFRDDEIRWETATTASTPTSYRLYQASRPNARHQMEAEAGIAKLYERAAQNYRSSAESATPQGIEAVIKMLEYARSTRHYKVFVTFSGDNEIPDDIESRLRASSGWTGLVPVNPSFTQTMNQAREARILQRISNSFGKIIPGDILQFDVGRATQDDISFNVSYTIRAKGDLYFPEKEQHLPEANRDWYTGISFEWLFNITVPRLESSTFHLSLQSSPAELFNVAYTRVEGQSEKMPPAAVYDAMADSAFNDFGSKLLSQIAVK